MARKTMMAMNQKGKRERYHKFIALGGRVSFKSENHSRNYLYAGKEKELSKATVVSYVDV